MGYNENEIYEEYNKLAALLERIRVLVSEVLKERDQDYAAIFLAEDVLEILGVDSDGKELS